MARILVVDDSLVLVKLTQALLEEAGFTVDLATDGLEALEAIHQSPPDVVVTGLQMPKMDGLQLVETIRQEHLFLPVVVMTEHGGEEIALDTLRKGAASYIPKKFLQRELVAVVDDVLAAAITHRQQQRLQQCLTQIEFCFVLENDPDLFPPLISELQHYLAVMHLCDEISQIRVGVALREALTNAVHHGNLEVSSDLRESNDAPYYDLIQQRLQQRPYGERRIHVHASYSRSKAVYVVRDEGPGFDPAQVPMSIDFGREDKPTGRGLFLIRTFMDLVQHNREGNEITMVKLVQGEEQENGSKVQAS